MSKYRKLLFSALAFTFVLSAFPVSALTDDEIEKFNEKSKNFSAMYFIYDMAMMNAYNQLDEKVYDALEKKNDTAATESAKTKIKSGMGEAEAYDFAYGERIHYTNRETAAVMNLEKDNPLAGYYELKSDALDGYMDVEYDADGRSYFLNFVVWMKNEPSKIGRSSAVAAESKGKLISKEVAFIFGGVGNDDLPDSKNNSKVQITVSMDGNNALVTTPDAFKKGSSAAKGVVIDGKYVREKKKKE